MKKVGITVITILSLCIVFYFSLRSNTPYEVSTPTGLTVEKILDPFSNIKNEDLYYISDDKGYFNAKIENNLNTKSISQFYSTGYKKVTTIKKGDLIAGLSKKIISVYYHDSEWYSFDSGDTCVAILQDNNNGQNYIAGIFPPTLCK